MERAISPTKKAFAVGVKVFEKSNDVRSAFRTPLPHNVVSKSGYSYDTINI